MLLEEHAFVRHVLIDDPESLAVHRHDKTAAHLAQWLEVHYFIRAWQGSGSSGGPKGRDGRARLRRAKRKIRIAGRLELQPLRNRAVRTAAQLEILGDRAKRTGNYRARRSRQPIPRCILLVKAAGHRRSVAV